MGPAKERGTEQDRRASEVELLRLLHDALGRLGVSVRVEAMPEEAHLVAGHCVLRGVPVLFLSPHAGVAEQREAMIEALRSVATDAVWLPPALRRLIGDEGVPESDVPGAVR
jgi:hypothetical protein